MTSRVSLSALALGITLAAVGCGKDNPTTPTPAADPKFTATLLPSNEVPAVSNAEQSGSGTVTITMHNTKDAAGNITASTADFTFTLTGFPAGTTLTAAHIHPGAAGTNGSPAWNLNLVSGANVLTNGTITVTVNGVAPTDVATAQAILNNPAGFYFNVHTTQNTGGVARGQLVKAN